MKGRDVRTDGVTMTVPVFIEVRNWLNFYFVTRAYERENLGLATSPGEKKGAGPALARVLCWLASLGDEDLERIQTEGGELLDILGRLPAGYGKAVGRVDPVPIRRREESVFAPGSGNPGPGVPREVDVKPLGVVRVPRRGEPEGDHVDVHDVSALPRSRT